MENNKLSKEENKVIEVLKEWSKPTSEFDGLWFGYEELSHESRININSLKKIMKSLKEKGIVDLEPTYCDEHTFSGRGYFIR